MENKERDQQQSNRTAEELQQNGAFNNEPAKDDNTSAAGLQSVIDRGRSASDRFNDSNKTGRSGGILDGQAGS